MGADLLSRSDVYPGWPATRPGLRGKQGHAAARGWRSHGHGVAGSAETTGRFANIGAVPTISRFFGIAITMYFDDHGLPHFHAWHPDGTAKIRIDEIDVIECDL